VEKNPNTCLLKGGVKAIENSTREEVVEKVEIRERVGQNAKRILVKEKESTIET